MGRTAWRSCSLLLVLQQLGVSGSHTVPVAFFLPQTSVRWGPLSGCGIAATPAVSWAAIAWRRSKRSLVSPHDCKSCSRGKQSLMVLRQAVNL